MLEIQTTLAFYLDKLKMKSPLLYLLVQVCLYTLLLLFSTDKLSINATIDPAVITVLGGLLIGISPRTSVKAQEYKDTKQEQDFPAIDQSNN